MTSRFAGLVFSKSTRCMNRTTKKSRFESLLGSSRWTLAQKTLNRDQCLIADVGVGMCHKLHHTSFGFKIIDGPGLSARRQSFSKHSLFASVPAVFDVLCKIMGSNCEDNGLLARLEQGYETPGYISDGTETSTTYFTALPSFSVPMRSQFSFQNSSESCAGDHVRCPDSTSEAYSS